MFTERINELADKYFKDISRIREEIHMYPEVGFEEFKTSELICSELEKMGIEYTKNIAKTGVVGIIKGKHPGKTVLLRADMDALLIQETADVEYKSKRDGYMHACGHDGHVAGVLGAAMVLNELKDELHGNIKLLFQPAEEDEGGAKPMIDEGVLENPKVDAVFGCHLWGVLKEGSVHVKKGAMMASRDTFKFKVIGKGGHGAAPHLSVDPIIIVNQAINNMQSILSRRIDPLSPAVISYCSIHGGASHNIIPGEVNVTGTIRTLNDELRAWIPNAMEEVIKGITTSQGASYEFELIKSYPTLFNDKEMTDLVYNSSKKIVGCENVDELEVPVMGSEDFAYFTRAVPSSFYFIGIAPSLDKPVCHHHPEFGFDNKNLLVSTKTLSQIAIDFLENI